MYPDSVNLVNPPNTTMPKTPAALPSSQYATFLSLVLGQLEDLPVLFEAASAIADASRWAVPVVALLFSGRVDFHRTDCKTEGRDAGVRAEKEGRSGGLAHGRLTNSRRVSRGAAVLN